MTGAELITYVKRNLNEQSVVLSADREAEILQSLNLACERMFQEVADMYPEGFTTSILIDKAADFDAYPINAHPTFLMPPFQKILEVRANDYRGPRLTRANELNTGFGDYDIVINVLSSGLYSIILSDSWKTTERIAVRYVPKYPGVPITGSTLESSINIPKEFHEALGLRAAYDILSRNEEDDGSITWRKYERSMNLAMTILSRQDPNGDSVKFANEFAQSMLNLYNDI